MKLRNVLSGFQRRWKSMCKYIRGRKEALADFGILKKLELLKEEKDLSRLLSFETIKAKTFYQIQKLMTENNQKEALNLLGSARKKVQEKAWSKIVERYYKDVDEGAFNSFLKKTKKETFFNADILLMRIGLQLVSIGIDSGWEYLKEAGINAESIEQANQKIKAKITNYELRKGKTADVEQKNVDFYEMWGFIQKRGYHVSSELLLPEWIGILKNIKKENGREDSKG